MGKKYKGVLICIYLILFSSLFLSSALSKCITNVTGTGEMIVAGIKLNVTTDMENLENLSNAEQSVYFSVNNYEKIEGGYYCSDVEYEYQIFITTKQNIPIQYEVYKIENDVEILVGDTEGILEKFTMPHSNAHEDNFVLKIKMDNKEYKNLEDILSIEVYAVQS